MRIFSYFLGYAFLSFRMKIHQCYRSHKRPFHITALAQLTSHHHQKDEALIPPKSPQAVPSLTLHLLWQLPNCTAKAVWISRELDQEKCTFSCWVGTLYGIPVQFHRQELMWLPIWSSHWEQTAREKGRRHLLFGSTVLLLWLAI